MQSDWLNLCVGSLEPCLPVCSVIGGLCTLTYDWLILLNELCILHYDWLYLTFGVSSTSEDITPHLHILDC